ncbi:MAG: hypothetical protein ACJAWL_003473, partial [Motiliproteus sp.]
LNIKKGLPVRVALFYVWPLTTLTWGEIKSSRLRRQNHVK